MNKTNFEHGMYVIALQVIGLLVGSALTGEYSLAGVIIGYAFGMGVFTHREYNHAERRAQSVTGKTLTELQAWHVVSHTSLDGILDWLIPFIMGGVVILSLVFMV